MELDKLREVYKQEEDSKVRERLLMVIWLAEGRSSYEIGKLLFCQHSKVLYWKYRFEEEGISGLRDKPRSGKPPKLSENDAKHIRGEIGDGTKWQTKAIRELIRSEAGATYSERHVVRLMHVWGFEKIKPRRRHTSADEEERKRFSKKTESYWQLCRKAG